MGSWINQIYLINKVLSGNPDFRELDWLSMEEKKDMAEELLKNIYQADANVNNIVNCVGYIIPRISEVDRLGYASRIIAVLDLQEDLVGRSKFQVLDAELLRSLSYSDRIYIGNLLRDNMKQSRFMSRESNMWGLVRMIPYVREIHQKEYAHDVFMLSDDGFMRQHVLDALCTMIFSLSRENRTDMVFFFSELLKKSEGTIHKFFTLELLKKVTSSIPQKDRGMISDSAAALLFDSDSDIVRKSLDYFATVISFLTPDHRYHYAQMIQGLVGDMILKDQALQVLEKVIPFLTSDNDKESVRKTLAQFPQELESIKSEDQTYAFESVLYAYEN